jgi:predicted DsbA family dithiol-disulfide isomerase
MSVVQISYYSDILCVWAYVAHRRIEQLVDEFGDKLEIDAHFCSVFADAHGKIETQWKNKGSYEGFNRHLNEVGEKFPHVTINNKIWLENKPRSSASPHIFVKAIEIIDQDELTNGAVQKPYLDRLSTQASWALRYAFFADAQDISDWNIHKEIAKGLGIDYALVEEKLRSSEAVAQLVIDYQISQKHHVVGSPTFIMNEGRQKLFGNVGYRLIQANVQEVLHHTSEDIASWC